MSTAIATETRAAIRASLAAQPGAVLEDLAAAHAVPVAEVVACLGEGEAVTVGGDRFEAVMREIATWGEVTFIVNTPDLVFESKGRVPKGSLANGYYNLFGAPIGGHLRASRCASISFVSRKLFTSETHSVQFYNHEGGCMFKVYLGRDAKRELIPEQVALYRRCREAMAAH